jgi:hypothetical protein
MDGIGRLAAAQTAVELRTQIGLVAFVCRIFRHDLGIGIAFFRQRTFEIALSGLPAKRLPRA